MDVLGHKVHPVPVVRRWVREIAANHPVARSEIRAAERACSLWVLLAAALGVSTLEDVFVGAFRLFVSTGAVGRRA